MSIALLTVAPCSISCTKVWTRLCQVQGNIAMVIPCRGIPLFAHGRAASYFLRFILRLALSFS